MESTIQIHQQDLHNCSPSWSGYFSRATSSTSTSPTAPIKEIDCPHTKKNRQHPSLHFCPSYFCYQNILAHFTCQCTILCFSTRLRCNPSRNLPNKHSGIILHVHENTHDTHVCRITVTSACTSILTNHKSPKQVHLPSLSLPVLWFMYSTKNSSCSQKAKINTGWIRFVSMDDCYFPKSLN